MPYTSFPTDDDFENFLKGTNLWYPNVANDLVGYMEAQINVFQKMTGRLPFLGKDDDEPTVVYCDPPGQKSKSVYAPWMGGGKYLELPTNFRSISEIAMAVGPSNPVGTPLNIGQQVNFYPYNHEVLQSPIEAVEFVFNAWGSYKSIRITGIAGYSDTIPADVWNGLMAGAAMNFLPVISANISDGMIKQREADVEQQYDKADTLDSLAKSFKLQWDRIVTRYSRIKILFT